MQSQAQGESGGGFIRGSWTRSNFVLCEGDSGVITAQKCLCIILGTLYVAKGKVSIFLCCDNSEALAIIFI